MNLTELETFEKLVGQIESVYDEMSILSKKSPNDAVNPFKLNFVNTLLNKANALLGKRYRPFSDFTIFNLDSVPQNSDSVFILSQYLQCFEKMRADNVVLQHGSWRWSIDAPDDPRAEDGKIYIRSVAPKRLREKLK